MRFRDKHHEDRYVSILSRMRYVDCYHSCVAYLLALDTNICDYEERINRCFDFAEDVIRKNVLKEAWTTHTDKRILRLAFNLWGNKVKANVSDVFTFGSVDYAEYLFEAIRIRYEY